MLLKPTWDDFCFVTPTPGQLTPWIHAVDTLNLPSVASAEIHIHRTRLRFFQSSKVVVSPYLLSHQISCALLTGVELYVVDYPHLGVLLIVSIVCVCGGGGHYTINKSYLFSVWKSQSSLSGWNHAAVKVTEITYPPILMSDGNINWSSWAVSAGLHALHCCHMMAGCQFAVLALAKQRENAQKCEYTLQKIKCIYRRLAPQYHFSPWHFPDLCPLKKGICFDWGSKSTNKRTQTQKNWCCRWHDIMS